MANFINSREGDRENTGRFRVIKKATLSQEDRKFLIAAGIKVDNLHCVVASFDHLFEAEEQLARSVEGANDGETFTLTDGEAS